MSRAEPVRPRLVDLAEDEHGADALARWPAAASVVRKPPPAVGAPADKQVRFAPEAHAAAPPPDDAEASMPADAPPVETPFVPVMGAIRERTEQDTPPERRAAPRTSRFRAQRDMDRALRDGRDEDGRPMSAFRRSRMMRAHAAAGGTHAAPPPPPPIHETERGAAADAHAGAARPSSAAASHDDDADAVHDPSRDPGGGAPPDQIAALLASVSAENAEKVSQMNYATVEDELRDAAAFFGADTLAKLKARRAPAADGAAAGGAAGTEAGAEAGTEARGAAGDVDLGAAPRAAPAPETTAEELESFRAKYFPDEPEAVNPALAWTVSPETSAAPPRVRFDFRGEVSWRPGAAVADDRTYLAGLHHHGEHQQAPGYTVDELLHLVQSSVASQRTLALQVLGRVCARFPQRLAPASPRAAAGDDEVAAALDADVSTPRAHILLSARWLLHDRHRSVRTAAVQCLASAAASVSVFAPEDAVRLARWPVCAAPQVDWLWLASLHTDALWTPHHAPAAIGESDASYVELVRRDWPATLLQTDVLATLDALAAAHAGLDAAAHGAALAAEAAETRAALLHLVFFLVVHSAAAATALPQHTHLVRLVAQLGGTACAWPLADPATWPAPCALAVVLRCVECSAAGAASLMGQGVLGGVLRYLVLPPLPPQHGAAHEREQALLFLAARILTALARYGQCSTSVREAWPALLRLGPWAASASALAAPAVLEMLALWTHLAQHRPHLGDLGVNWPAVRAWAEWSMHCVQHSPERDAHTAAMEHLACWARAAHALEPALVDADERAALVAAVQTRLAGVLPVARAHLAALHAARAAREAARAQPALDELVRTAAYVGAAQRLMHATPSWRWSAHDTCTAVQRELLASCVPEMLSMPVFCVDGTAPAAAVVLLAACGVQARALATAPHAGAEAGAPAAPPDAEAGAPQDVEADAPATSRDAQAGAPRDAAEAGASAASPDADALLALVTLPPQEGVLAQEILGALVQRWGARLWAVLMPFLSDLLERAGAPPPPPFSLVRTLQLAETPPALAVPRMPLGTPESDSVTGAALWQIPVAGLPLRRDWPWAPLDDLLHSGQAHVLNRANGLPTHWDYSERDIVHATLQVAVRAVHTALGARLPTLPQAAHVWLGIAKVFLLEQGDDAHGERYSGAATGRDLYADEPIRRLLQTLMRLADCAAYLDPSLSLEAAADALHTGVSFYQVYTDLLGLYDAVSLGDAVFAHALVPPLAMTYAADYRRLLWNDYAHCLRTIAVPLDAAPVATGGTGVRGDAPATDLLCIPPAHRVAGYLYPLESDGVVLSCYAKALIAGDVTPAQPLLYRIALHHVSAALWAPDERWADVRRAPERDALGRALFAASTPQAVQDAVLAYVPAGVQAGDRAGQRAHWVST